MAEMSASASTFNPEWSPIHSASAFLPSSPHKRKQRAWERQPRPASAPQNQSRRIWKRHDARPASQADQNYESAATSPMKAVKKLRVVNEAEAAVNFRKKHGIVAQYDRRKSCLPHKMRPEINVEGVQSANDEMDDGLLDVNAIAGAEVGIHQHDSPVPKDLEEPNEGHEAYISLQAGSTSEPSPCCTENQNEPLIPTTQSEIFESRTAEAQPFEEQVPQGLQEPSDQSKNLHKAAVLNVETSGENDENSSIPKEIANIMSPSTKSVLQNPIDDPDACLFDLSPVKVLQRSPRRKSPRKNSQSTTLVNPPFDFVDPVKENLQTPNSVIMSSMKHDLQNNGSLFGGYAEDGTTLDILDAIEAQDSENESQSPESDVDGNDTQTMDLNFASYEPTIENTVTTTMVDLNDDTDFINDFLSRAKASKAAKIAKRSSLSHKRDSDVVRLALASPRKALEDIDVNSPSPRKASEPPLRDNAIIPEAGATRASSPQPPTPSRRSLRTTIQSRSKAGTDAPSAVCLRRGDGSDCLVVKKTEMQELAQLTRNNTRRNKGGAVAVSVMLKKLAKVTDVDVAGIDGNTSGKTVRWNERLVDYFSKPEHVMDESDNQKHPTESFPASRAKTRRLKALGAVNGTPFKRSTVVEEPEVKEVQEAKKLRAPRRIPTPSKPLTPIGLNAMNEDNDATRIVAKTTEVRATDANKTRRRSIIPTRSRGIARV